MSSISRIYRGSTLVYEAPDKQPLAVMQTDLRVGDRIELFRAANIRTRAVISASTLTGVNPRGVRGTVVSGPEMGVQNSYWYEIDFDVGYDGWCVSDNYIKVTGSRAAIQTTPDYFKVGDDIRLFRAANVRAAAGTGAALRGVNPQHSLGVIVQGPVRAGTSNWYRIDFDEGHSGWVVSDNYVQTTQRTGAGGGGGGGATGPTVVPPPDNAPATVTVGSSSELLTALRNASANAIIGVRPGTYSAITASNISKQNVTIRPTDRQNPPRWHGTGFDLENIQGIIFDGLRFEGRNGGDGYPSGRAMRIRGYDNVIIRNCWFNGYWEQLFISPGSNGLIEWNLFTGCGMDSIRIFRTTTNLTIRNNEIRDPKINNARANEGPRHPDCIQFACNNDDPPSSGVTIENNVIKGNPTGGGYQQLIFMGNERWRRLGASNVMYGNFRIRNNYLEGAHTHGIFFEGARDITVQGNLIRRFSNFGSASINTPTISTQGRPSSGVIENNITPTVIGWGGSLENFTLRNNMVSSSETPSGWRMPPSGPYGYA